MKKALFSSVFIVVLVSFLSCSGQHGAANSSKEEQVAAEVNTIYNHVFECYGKGNDSADVFNQRYLTGFYLSFFDSIALYDSLYNQGNAGYWDYDRWVMAQDWDHPSFKLDSVVVSDPLLDSYWANITITNLGHSTSLHLLMMQEDGKWKIDEVLNDEWDPRSEIDRIVWYCSNLKNSN